MKLDEAFLYPSEDDSEHIDLIYFEISVHLYRSLVMTHYKWLGSLHRVTNNIQYSQLQAVHPIPP